MKRVVAGGEDHVGDQRNNNDRSVREYLGAGEVGGISVMER